MDEAESLNRAIHEHVTLSPYQAHWPSVSYNATLADRRWLMRYNSGHRTHHLHLMIPESDAWRQRLALRDRLRANTELAKRYEYRKHQWAQTFQMDREAYTAAKSAFIHQALSDA